MNNFYHLLFGESENLKNGKFGHVACDHFQQSETTVWEGIGVNSRQKCFRAYGRLIFTLAQVISVVSSADSF